MKDRIRDHGDDGKCALAEASATDAGLVGGNVDHSANDAASAGGAWFTLLPNPGDGLFQLVPVDGGGITGPLSYTVEDATGRVVVPQGRIAASTSVLMDMRPALPGVYLLRLVGEDGMQVLRAVVR